MDNSKAHGNVEEFHLPEWETTARHRGEKQAQTSHKSGFKERAFLVFDRVIPGHRKCLSASRKTACTAILVILVVLLALILGLAIGLSKKSKYAFVPALGLTLMTPNTTCLANIKIFPWDHRHTQANSPTTVLVSAPAVSRPRTPTTLYPSATLPSTLYPKAQIRMLIRCAGTN